ncbi:MAG: Sec-independent protein translocase protein TatB [Sulfurovum sp.]|nr:Sec-independent protein translocase protein TatB [Sulfurovum sp.]
MFGIGFTELLLVSIIAILFLGPEKLPGALVDMAKFIKSVKKTIGEAKSSLEEEVKIADLKEEALSYKEQLNEATKELRGFKNLSFDDFDEDVSYEEEVSKKSPQELTQQKKAQPTPSLTAKPETQNTTETITTQVEEKNELVTFTKKEKPASTKGDA